MLAGTSMLIDRLRVPLSTYMGIQLMVDAQLCTDLFENRVGLLEIRFEAAGSEIGRNGGNRIAVKSLKLRQKT